MPEADIIIIGGGIAGTSSAYYLAQLGHNVTLLERGEIAGEASGVNAGGLGGIGWGAILDLQAYLTMGSLEEFKALQLDHGYDLEFRQSGTLQSIHTEPPTARTQRYKRRGTEGKERDHATSRVLRSSSGHTHQPEPPDSGPSDQYAGCPKRLRGELK